MPSPPILGLQFGPVPTTGGVRALPRWGGEPWVPRHANYLTNLTLRVSSGYFPAALFLGLTAKLGIDWPPDGGVKATIGVTERAFHPAGAVRGLRMGVARVGSIATDRSRAATTLC